VTGGQRVDVAFTPRDMRPSPVAVVVDVLRATSTIVAALDAGYRRVLCTASVERARRLRGPGRVLAGERGCRPIDDFDRGNSPRGLDTRPADDLVLCTTNGTPAILSAASMAGEVLIGSLLNLDAVVEQLPPDKDLSIVCAGTEGRFALEDAYVAGRIVQRIRAERTDAALAAEQLGRAYDDPYQPLAQSADAAMLRATGQMADIAFCARDSTVAVVPQVSAATAEVVVVSPADPPVAPGTTYRYTAKALARLFT
jgi:2-phosphosulfolactate phosphatase